MCGRSTGSKNSKSFCQTEFNFTGKRKCTLKVYDEVNGIIQNTTEPAIKMNVELTGTAKDAAGTDKFCKINNYFNIIAIIHATQGQLK